MVRLRQGFDLGLHTENKAGQPRLGNLIQTVFSMTHTYLVAQIQDTQRRVFENNQSLK